MQPYPSGGLAARLQVLRREAQRRLECGARAVRVAQRAQHAAYAPAPPLAAEGGV